jgi:hypothetical protein
MLRVTFPCRMRASHKTPDDNQGTLSLSGVALSARVDRDVPIAICNGIYRAGTVRSTCCSTAASLMNAWGQRRLLLPGSP